MSHQQAIDLPCCAECGMPCSPAEFHPFAACLMFKGCHDSGKVRANLEFLTDRSRSAAPVAVPEGFVLVPREPTEAMILAGAGTRGMKAIDDSCTTMQLRGYSIDPEAFKGGAPLAQAWRAMLAAAPLATPLAPAETMKQLQIAEEFANSLCGMIGDISNALGISEEEQSCANGAEEILDAIEELKRAAPAETGEVGRLREALRQIAEVVPGGWHKDDGTHVANAFIREARAALAAPPGLAPLVAGVGEVL